MTRSTAYNSTFAIGGVSCSADSFVVAGSSVLRINISGKNPTHHKSAKRSKWSITFAMKSIDLSIMN
jgi:hypothetical protein